MNCYYDQARAAVGCVESCPEDEIHARVQFTESTAQQSATSTAPIRSARPGRWCTALIEFALGALVLVWGFRQPGHLSCVDMLLLAVSVLEVFWFPLLVLVLLFLGTLMLLFGRSTNNDAGFQAGSGDVGRFILQQAAARCGQVITQNGLPSLASSWRYLEDQYGVIIRMSCDDYQALETLLRQAFGVPRNGPMPTRGGGMVGRYRLAGGSLHFSRRAEDTQVIVLRCLTLQETGAALVKSIIGMIIERRSR